MLTPEQLQNLPQDLTDLYDQLSEFILRDIARRIAKGAQITDTAEYQLYRARSLGLSTDEIAAKIAEINGSSAAEINRLIREAAAQSDEFDRKMLGADNGAAIPLDANTRFAQLPQKSGTDAGQHTSCENNDCCKALKRIKSRIKINGIYEIIDAVPMFNKVRKQFLKEVIKARNEIIINHSCI